MTTPSTTQDSSWVTFRSWIRQPRVAGLLIVAYVVIAIVVILTLDRANVLFPLWSTLAFPPLVLSPFVIIASPLQTRVKAVILLTLLIIAMPLIGLKDSSYLELVIQICIFACLALGLNIVVGFAGLLDLGYIAFFALGAYSWAMFSTAAPNVFHVNGIILPNWAFFIFLFVGILVAGSAGILLGLPVLRLRGDYLAIVTLGFGEMIRVLAVNLDQPINLTNGSQGLNDVSPPPMAQAWVDFVGNLAKALNIRVDNVEPLARQLMFYFIAIAIIAIIIVIARRLQDSPIGRAWTAIREDETAAIAMGVSLVKMKLMAFAMGAAFAGAIGVLYAAKQTFVSPDSFVLIQSISILAMVIVGGMGSIRGVILGAIIVTLLNLQVLSNLAQQINNLKNIDYVVPVINFHITNWPPQLTPDKYQRFVFGILLVVMMIFRPAGLLPETRRLMELQEGVGETPTTLEMQKVSAEPAEAKE